MAEKIKLNRLDDTPWGFRLTGGLDFGTPITVVKVSGGSIASVAGIKVGDIVTEINGASTKNLTHTEAQNWIVRSGNLLYFTVIRGSVVTPPTTPFRGTTPTIEYTKEQNGEHDGDYDQYGDSISGGMYLNSGELTLEDGLTEREYTLLNGGEVPQPIIGIRIPTDKVSDLELDELLTGNEEVLDEGILGINFQKYFPQVDFIRHSEVFKMLQDDNTHKELPEEVQLQIDPAKRFSTFLQKPKTPLPPKQVGPYWHYPKAPKYLPRGAKRPTEEPKRRKEDTHSVLWLFLAKEGKKVIDERWGTPEEERKNISRNTNREDEGVIMPPLSHRNTPCSDFFLDGEPNVRDIFKPGVEPIYMEAPPIKKSEQPADPQTRELAKSEDAETSSSNNKPNIDKIEETKDDPMEQSAIETEIKESQKNEGLTDDNRGEMLSNLNLETLTEVAFDVNNFGNDIEEQFEIVGPKEETSEMKINFQNQLTKIKDRISELEGVAPNDVVSQLYEVQEQLKKILELNKTSTLEDESNINEDIMEQDIFFQADLEQESSMSATSDSEFVINYTINPYSKKTEDVAQEFMIEISNIDDKPVLQVREKDESQEDQTVEKYEMGEFEVCDTEEEKARHPPPLTKPFHPLTPAKRPIVLPGGRQWRQPKDAAHDDFYQGILVEQAEVLIGTNKSVNFKKYVPPKFDTDASPVCKLIREIEESSEAKQSKPETEFYQAPLTKRHFYNATLPQPAPVGTVELKDLI